MLHRILGHVLTSRGSPLAEPIISVSGLRGVVGETLTPDVAVRYAAALRGLCRPARSWSAATAGLRAGCWPRRFPPVYRRRAGPSTPALLATPTTGVLLRHCSAGGGIQITASHNPAALQRLETLLGRRTRHSRRTGPTGLGALSRGRVRLGSRKINSARAGCAATALVPP